MKKKVVFITRLFYPHLGGVEKQVMGLSKVLLKKGYQITVITEKYNNKLKDNENINGIDVIRISYPQLPIIGLLVIWLKMLTKCRLFFSSSLIHAYGSFIWILPLRIIIFWKHYFTTFFGWEGIYPIPLRFIILRKLVQKLSHKTTADAGFIEKYYKVKANVIRYPSANTVTGVKNNIKKDEILYVGRLDEDVGILNILAALKELGNYNVTFCGDGVYKNECSDYGKVLGFTNPEKYYSKSRICLSAGHTSIIEAFFHKCLITTTYNNVLKRDYLLMTPFNKWIVVEKNPKILAKKIEYYMNYPEKSKTMVEEAYDWVQKQTWENMAKMYESLWGIKKET